MDSEEYSESDSSYEDISDESDSDEDTLDAARNWCRIDQENLAPPPPRFPFSGNPGGVDKADQCLSYYPTLAYELRKQRSYTTIYMGVERKYQALIADTEDGKTAFDTLKANFEPSSRARLASLVDDFFSSRFDVNEETIGIHSKKIVEKN
ncbi:hypothetical protein AVEN_85564-1 [Araneus ventricosus]|uniref:Uncharacterized protein n=1 Tax=Araneus ventricosus TaxID=182803 RepID=A0A4Y2X045_ARAVE|nr:hypothetical protein AVEN_85564-1 [Araneus ventricosus]